MSSIFQQENMRVKHGGQNYYPYPTFAAVQKPSATTRYCFLIPPRAPRVLARNSKTMVEIRLARLSIYAIVQIGYRLYTNLPVTQAK